MLGKERRKKIWVLNHSFQDFWKRKLKKTDENYGLNEQRNAKKFARYELFGLDEPTKDFSQLAIAVLETGF